MLGTGYERDASNCRAGLYQEPLVLYMPDVPNILVFDSGLGGLTVFAEAVLLRPDARFFYAADDAGFPYGRLGEAQLIERVMAVMARLIARIVPDVVVIGCNTASTLVLPHLRAAYPKLPFVGTVPAVKPAAAQSHSHLISVLATPGTVARDYTHDLVRTYAAHCEVTLVGSRELASLAEAYMKGEPVSDEQILREIAPCFVEANGKRTDCIALACTHYPLLQAEFERLAPWPVDWIDPAPAIARRVDHVLKEDLGFSAPQPASALSHQALFTGPALPQPALDKALRARHFEEIVLDPMPLVMG
jgi:glutamate racemase